MSSYTAFAEFYDALTTDVDYQKRAEYVCTLLARYDHPFGLTLDLACGTGSLTVELAQRGIDIYGVDGSSSMLTVAQQKAAESNTPLLFLCQQMQELDLFGTVDTVLCMLDSINHLIEEADVIQVFSRVSLFLNPGGYFVFDVNTPYKHRHVLGNHTFLYETEQIYCIWQNALEEETGIVEITLDFFARQQNGLYNRQTECFCERPYGTVDLARLLECAGLEPVAMYDDGTFTPASPQSERWMIIAKKPDNSER